MVVLYSAILIFSMTTFLRLCTFRACSSP